MRFSKKQMIVLHSQILKKYIFFSKSLFGFIPKRFPKFHKFQPRALIKHILINLKRKSVLLFENLSEAGHAGFHQWQSVLPI